MLPVWPMIEEMFTIRPVPRSSMCSSAARDMKKAPERLTATTEYHCSSVILSAVLSVARRDLRSTRCQPAADGRSDPARAAGDHRHAAGEQLDLGPVRIWADVCRCG